MVLNETLNSAVASAEASMNPSGNQLVLIRVSDLRALVDEAERLEREVNRMKGVTSFTPTINITNPRTMRSPEQVASSVIAGLQRAYR